jgi:hypothetical protein
LRVRFPVAGLKLGAGTVTNNPQLDRADVITVPLIAGVTFESSLRLQGSNDASVPSNRAAVDPRVFSIVKASYSLQEAAKLLSLSVATLYRELNCGRLIRTKRRGRALLLAPDLIAYLTQPQEDS